MNSNRYRGSGSQLCVCRPRFCGYATRRFRRLSSRGAVFFLIAAGNLLLAVFNLLPGYPLDGGRVLRALLWRRSGDIFQATRLAGICGILVAGTLIIFGIYMAVAPSFRAYFMGLWSVLVGLFLLDPAVSVVRRSSSLRTATVSDAMSPPFALEPDLADQSFPSMTFCRFIARLPFQLL